MTKCHPVFGIVVGTIYTTVHTTRSYPVPIEWSHDDALFQPDVTWYNQHLQGSALWRVTSVRCSYCVIMFSERVFFSAADYILFVKFHLPLFLSR